MTDAKGLVPKGGLEPPHPCEYMDLNHARLPIPPLRHGDSFSVHQGEHTNRELSVFQSGRLKSMRANIRNSAEIFCSSGYVSRFDGGSFRLVCACALRPADGDLRRYRTAYR